MADMMADALDWFAERLQAYASRTVTYTGIRAGVAVGAELTVGLGQSELAQINSLGTDPSIAISRLTSPVETQRDYIVVQSDMRGAGLWPPVKGDTIDDANDVDGVTYRFRVMGVPGQADWRPLAGSYAKMARIHARFYKELVELWTDNFTGSDGTLLTLHTADTGGSYSGGTGTISIVSNRIVAGAASAHKYFSHGETGGTETRVQLSFNGIAAADLNGKYADLGAGIRVAASGSGLRDGYYVSVRVGYTGSLQTTKQIRISEVASGVETLRASKTVSEFLNRSAEYQLAIFDTPTGITARLADSTGDVSLGSVGYATTTYYGNVSGAVRFNHEPTLASYATPYLDTLLVSK